MTASRKRVTQKRRAWVPPVTPITLSRLRPPYIAYIDCVIATPFNHGANHMKQLIIGITVVLAFHVGNVEAAQWVPLDEAEDGQRIRTNNGPEEGRIICTSKTRGKGKGIAKDGRRLGFLTKKGCKTIGGGDKVLWFTREDGDIMVLVDDEPAVQDVQGMIDSALEGMVPEEDVQGQIDAALVGMVSEQDVQGQIDAALEEAGWVHEGEIRGNPRGWGQYYDVVMTKGEGKPSFILAYGKDYGAKILMKNDDGGWEEQPWEDVWNVSGDIEMQQGRLLTHFPGRGKQSEGLILGLMPMCGRHIECDY